MGIFHVLLPWIFSFCREISGQDLLMRQIHCGTAHKWPWLVLKLRTNRILMLLKW